jgi:hydrogenase nickel incorporation protein HypA/HybF
MHEVAIAESLLETAIWNCKDKGFSSVKNVRIKIGKASVISSEALLFNFDALKAGSIASEAALIIEEILTVAHCKTCGKDFSVERDFIFQCPHCNSDIVIISSGNGIELKDMEIEVV